MSERPEERDQAWIDSQMFDDEDREEDDDFDCGDIGDGYCCYAGTEWCDFECPYRSRAQG